MFKVIVGNFVSDELLNRLKEEQNEDNAWDRKTEDLNYNSDKQLSSDDDTFVGNVRDAKILH